MALAGGEPRELPQHPFPHHLHQRLAVPVQEVPVAGEDLDGGVAPGAPRVGDFDAVLKHVVVGFLMGADESRGDRDLDFRGGGDR